MSKAKCAQCRKDKAKCTPFLRTLPQRCDRCIRFDHPCSENRTTKEASIIRSTPPEVVRATESLPETDATYLQELGDLRNIMETITTIKDLSKRSLAWEYEQDSYEAVQTRLEKLETEIANRTRQLLKDGFLMRAEYLLSALRTHKTGNVQHRLEAAHECLKDTSYRCTVCDNDPIYLRSLVEMHEQIGDFPRAERETELLIILFTSENWSWHEREKDLLDHARSLWTLHTSALDRVKQYNIGNLQENTLIKLIWLSQLLRVINMRLPSLFVEFWKLNASPYPSPLAGNRWLGDLLDSGGFDVNKRDTNGYTTLHLAVNAGCVDLVRLLLEAGASFNIPSLNGDFPLDLAAFLGCTEIFKILLDAGAPVNSWTHEPPWTQESP